MVNQIEHRFTCPYCWRAITMLIDLSVESQSYVEDCEGCCHPIEINYRVEEETLVEFKAEKAQ